MTLSTCGNLLSNTGTRALQNYMQNGNYTARGDIFDIGGATHRAISNYLRGKPALECGDDSDSACGNGSLMRIMPLAFYLEGKYGNWKLDKRTAEIIHKASDCTHANRRCEMACGIYCSIISVVLREKWS